MIQIRNVLLAYDSITMSAVEPIDLQITKDELMDYMKEYPMPKDMKYSQKDFIHDITQSSGFYSFPEGIKKETVEYIEDALNDL